MNGEKIFIVCENCGKKYRINKPDEKRVFNCKECDEKIVVYPSTQIDSSNKKEINNSITIIISIISIILALIAIIYTENTNKEIDNVKNETMNLNSEVNDLQFYLANQRLEISNLIDLSNSSIQDIGDGFKVAELNTSKHMTGVKIKGRVINMTSCTHQSINFKIYISNQEKTIFITQISPGHSTSFDTYIPDVPIEKARWATFKYIESVLKFKI